MPDKPKTPGKKVAGVPVIYPIAGAVALVVGLGWMWLQRRKAAAASSSTAAAAPTSSSNTGISGDLLNAILRDWQQHPPSSSTATGTGGGAGGGGGTSSGTGTGGTGRPGQTTSTVTGGGKGGKGKGGKGKTSVTVTGRHPTGPPAHYHPPAVSYTDYTVRAGQTLAEIAKANGITVAQLAHSNTYAPGEAGGKTGQTLGTGAGLKTGQVLRIPHYSSAG